MEKRLKVLTAGVLFLAWAAGVHAASPGALTPLLADATLGRAVVEFIGAGVAFGALSLGLRVFVERWRARRTAVHRTTVDATPLRGVVVALTAATDVTTSQSHDRRQRSFAAVVSLTEVLLARQIAQRSREKQRAARSRA